MGTILSDLSPFAKGELEREFRYAMAHGAATTDEVRVARVLMEVGAVEAYPANVALALSVAARLEPMGFFTTGQVRLYSRGLAAYRQINEVVAAAS